MDSFTQLSSAITKRLSELKRMTVLRVEEGSKDSCQQELAGLDAMVRALEGQVSTLKSCIQRELTAMPKVEALIEASRLQSEHLNAISANLPARLPRGAAAFSSCSAALQGSSVQGAMLPLRADVAGACGGAANGADDGASKRARAKEPREAPRWYVTESELAAVSSYMRGRLTLDKVNAALDELAGHAATNLRTMAAVRNPAGGGGAGAAKLAPAERKRATDLLHGVANKEGIKGHFWFLEADLREGQLVKLDKSGKAMLTLLRHLGRLQEVRCNLDGASTLVYVMQEDPRRSVELGR